MRLVSLFVINNLIPFLSWLPSLYIHWVSFSRLIPSFLNLLCIFLLPIPLLIIFETVHHSALLKLSPPLQVTLPYPSDHFQFVFLEGSYFSISYLNGYILCLPLFIISLGDFIHSFNFHLFANDSQIYISAQNSVLGTRTINTLAPQ